MFFTLSRKNFLKSFLWGIAFLFPIGIGSVAHWASGFFFMALLISLVCLGRNWTFPKGLERYILIALGLFVLVSALSLINADDLSAGMRRLEKILCALYAIPLYLFFKREKLDLTKPLLYGCLLAGPYMALIAAYHVYVQEVARVDGHYTSIIFGQLTMLVALLTLVGLWCGRFSGRYKYIAVVSFLCGIYASLLSGTRGALIALPVMILFLLVINMRNFSWRKTILLISVFLTFILAIAVNDNANARFGIIYKQIERYHSGEDLNSSVGVRLVLWQDSIHLWQNAPLLGVGIGSFYHAHKQSIEKRKISLNRIFTHPHNVFFDTLVSSGLFGLVSFVGALFVMPAMLFWRFARAGSGEGGGFPSLAGATILLCHVIFGLTEGWTLHMEQMVVFFFLLVLCMTATTQDKINPNL